MPRHRTLALIAPALAVCLAATGLAATSAGAAAERRPTKPHRIALPDGFQPEGIAGRGGPRAYLGSLADGDIYVANLRTGDGHRIHQGDGTPSVGLKLDHRGRLWVAGGPDGDAKVVKVRHGRTVAHYDFTSGTSFVNDVVLRGNAAWFTDSQRAVLYKVSPLGGRAADARVRAVPLKGAWQQVAGQFNANGIETTPGGEALLVVQSFTGKLFRVNPANGRAKRVRLGGYTLTNGDGLLRRGRTLYVAQNQDNLVAKIRLSPDGRRGHLLRKIRSAGFDFPTTITHWAGGLYLPNARFSTTPTPTTKYWITRVHR